MHERRRRRRCDGDDGFTLLELMVALTVLAVGIVGVTGVMTSSFKVADAGRTRSKAVAVATEQIEALRAVPYAQLLVTSTASESDIAVGGTTFHVQRAISWKADAAITDAYKGVTVQVSWSDQTGFHEVHQSSAVYPGGLGPYAGSLTPGATGAGDPAAPTLLVAVAVPATSGVELTWTPPLLSSPPPESYVVQYATDSSFASYQESTAAVPAATPIIRINDLAPATTYHFRVASRAANGNLSTSWAYAYNVQTSASSITTCSVGTAAVTPSAVKKKSGSAGSGLTTSPQVSVSLIGVCAGTVLRIDYSPLGNGAVESVTLTGTGGTRGGQVGSASQAWTVGDHDIDVFDNTGARRATLRLIVCDQSKQACP